MESRGILSPRRSNPNRTPPAHLPGSTSAPELTIQSAIPCTTSNRRTTKKGKAVGCGSRKDGSGLSHKKFSDYSPNHSPSPARTRDLQQLSIHDDTNEQNNPESNTPILSKIYKEIAFHRQGKTSIKTYYENLKALWNEAASSTCTNSPQSSSNIAIVDHIELMERDKLMLFLLGLKDSYSSLCSQFLLKPSQTVDEAYSTIIREKKGRKCSTSKKEAKY
ncbi:uncharacterized protein E6C27_scaffold96G00010 [Cucumis melo var. makuwa]|uniref:Retrotransposon gag domain-containing protein n=1 Tax=Cucumis melo var. makuwa TaxID=1194695 RepID=A0A5A7UNP6_CUCMM|nr:uncharacterized protein E6C27_scaffold96G00010 [Cucumis melo var. makuwa]